MNEFLIFCADPTKITLAHEHNEFLKQRAQGYWRKAAVVSWMVSLNLSMQ